MSVAGFPLGKAFLPTKLDFRRFSGYLGARDGARGPVDLGFARTEEPARALRPRTRLSAAALKHHKKRVSVRIPFLVIFERETGLELRSIPANPLRKEV